MATKLSPGTFFGQTQAGVAVLGLTFAESVYAAESELYLPPHAHEDDFLHFVIEGACEEVYGRRRRTLGVSGLAFHPAGEPHSNRWHGPGGRVFHVDLSRARADSIREYAPGLDRPAEFLGGVAPWLTARLYREYRHPEGPSALAMEGLALEILAEMRFIRRGRAPA
jgi:AraC family transcriptional regulator